MKIALCGARVAAFMAEFGVDQQQRECLVETLKVAKWQSFAL
jgi:hypothetical protein